MTARFGRIVRNGNTQSGAEFGLTGRLISCARAVWKIVWRDHRHTRQASRARPAAREAEPESIGRKTNSTVLSARAELLKAPEAVRCQESLPVRDMLAARQPSRMGQSPNAWPWKAVHPEAVH